MCACVCVYVCVCVCVYVCVFMYGRLVCAYIHMDLPGTLLQETHGAEDVACLDALQREPLHLDDDTPFKHQRVPQRLYTHSHTHTHTHTI